MVRDKGNLPIAARVESAITSSRPRRAKYPGRRLDMRSIGYALLLVFTLRLPASSLPESAPKLTLGRPIQAGPLAVIPIRGKAMISHEKYITLSDAVKKGLVEIVEVPGDEQVNRLEVRNKAELPLMLFAGELLIGGKQDRIVGKDSIIPPHESDKVPVFCVEYGR